MTQITTITQDEIEALNDMTDGWELEEVGYSDFFAMVYDLLGDARSQQFTDADYEAWVNAD